MKNQGKHFAQKNKISKRTKRIVLSVVALLELILLVTSVTFSWFEGLSSLELKGDDFQTADILNSHIEIGENSSATDATYNAVVDLKTFFDAQKEVRLSPVSSADAENFYAPYSGDAGKTGTKYRRLSKADVNSNIIQFEFNISAPHGNTDFYLTESLPLVQINDKEYNYKDKKTSPYRFAFSDGSQTLIFRNNNELNSSVAYANATQQAISSLKDDDTAVISTGMLSNPQEYAYYKDHRDTVDIPNTTGAAGVKSAIRPVFHLNKGETKPITVTVWIEALDYECVNKTSNAPVSGDPISFDIKLCSTWSITREITVYDYTAIQWIDTKDSLNRTTALFVRNADGDSDNRQYQLTYNSELKSWRGFIPIALNNCEFLWGTIKNNRCNPNETWGKFQAPNRNNAEVITILGLDSACVWDLYPDELVKIDFRDYTPTTSSDPDGWINNKDGLGNDVDINVEIVYDGRTLDYSMTDKPTQDNYGKNSWSCWIPNTVNQVDFSRRGYKSANNYIEFNRWYGTDRNGETIYRATGDDGGTTGGSTTDGPFTLYVKIDSAIADTFYATSRGRHPAISFTGDANRTLWDRTANKTTISRFDYKPNTDTWPNGESELTRLGNTNTWYMTFSEKPDPGTYVTVWSRSGANNFNDIALDMSFGVFYLFEDGKNYNTITITTAQALTSSGASNNYALLGTMSNENISTGGGIESEGNIGTGVWGEKKAPPQSGWNNPTTFVHVSDVDSVKVTFTYENIEWTMDMTKDTTDTTGRTWITKAIPDSGATNIKFTDSNGKTWIAPTSPTRSNIRHRLYATDTNGGCVGWRTKLTPTSGSGTTYVFKHYNTATTSVTVSYVTSVGVPFTFSLTKGSDNLSWSTTSIPDDATSVKYTDGTRTWTISDFNSSTPVCFALDNNQYLLRDSANYARIYLEKNWGWSNIKIYYTGTDAPSLPGKDMIDLGRKVGYKKDRPLYAYLVPTNANKIAFTGIENNVTKYTVNITANHNNDMTAFYFDSWDANATNANNGKGAGKCASYTISASNLN